MGKIFLRKVVRGLSDCRRAGFGRLATVVTVDARLSDTVTAAAVGDVLAAIAEISAMAMSSAVGLRLAM